MKKKQPNPDTVEIKATCIGCHKTQTLTADQIKQAEMVGAAISTCCHLPMTVEEAAINPKKSKKHG